MIRAIGSARSATYLYHQKGSIDDDCDDGTESLMSWMSRMTKEKGLWLAEKCTRGTHVTPVTGQNHFEL